MDVIAKKGEEKEQSIFSKRVAKLVRMRNLFNDRRRLLLPLSNFSTFCGIFLIFWGIFQFFGEIFQNHHPSKQFSFPPTCFINTATISIVLSTQKRIGF